MRNFDPVSYNRQKWLDPKRTRNKPSSCSAAHRFCNFDYQWGSEAAKNKEINRPINPNLPNVDLPGSQQKSVTVNYESMTQENLDDWVAQSINRSLASMLNPQKKFFLPSHYDEQLRNRYRKNRELAKVADDELYFGSARRNTKTYLMNERKKKTNAHQLCFDYHKLSPQQEMFGTPIKLRQDKKVKNKQIVRRNAVLLNNDLHYARFLKQLTKQKVDHESETHQKQHQIKPHQHRQMIYSFNLESMKRKDCFEQVPNSIIEKQFQRIRAPKQEFLSQQRALLNKQEELHQKYRQMMNEKANQAVNTIKDLAHPKDTTDIIKGMLKMAYPKKNSKNTTNTKNQLQLKQQKKGIQHRVIKLLNNMQVKSQNIDENMSRLNIHTAQIFLEHPDSRPQIKWILKAQEKVKSHQNQLAIDFYKQAIIIQPEMFIPVFNIAVLLEKENMLDLAGKWFQLAVDFDTDSDKVSFGSSVVALKQLRYEDSLKQINDLIIRSEVNNKQTLPVHYYIRALCSKQLKDYKSARKDYLQISKNLKPSNYNILPDFIFSVVFSKQRRIPLVFNCLSYMLFKQAIFIILYENTKKLRQENQKIESLADKIILLPFFKRFSLKLVKKLLTHATYTEKDKDEIIFNEDDRTCIILNGLISLKCHEKDISRPIIVSVLGKGGVIGSGDLQHNLSSKPNNWFMTISPVEYITVPKKQFQIFWKGQITFQIDFKLNFLRNVKLFKGLSQSTLLKLCETLKNVTYEKGTVLFNDCSYRHQFISQAGKGYGLAKVNKKTDPRFVRINKHVLEIKKKGPSRLFQILKKHIFKFNQMKFNRLKYPGLLIISKGMVEIEDDWGFRCTSMICERDFFGENLIINSDGFHNYGRMVVQSDVLEAYLLQLDDLIWFFTEEDKEIMKENCKKRQGVDTIRFLRHRFEEYQFNRFKCRMKN